MNLRETPYVRILLPFLSGILLQQNTFLPDYCSIGLLFILFLTLFFLHLIQKKTDFHKRHLFGLSFSLFLLGLGLNATLIQRKLKETIHFEHYLAKENVFVGSILQIKKTKHKTNVLIKVKFCNNHYNKLVPVYGALLIHVKDSNLSKELIIHQKILVRGTAKAIKPNLNPNTFDYQKFLGTKEIYHQLFVNEKDTIIKAPPPKFSIFANSYRVQQALLKILKQHLSPGNELGVAAALVLGYKDLLPLEIKSAYSDTGTMHVLAVSGLHVGLVYLALNFLLSFIKLNHPIVPYLRLCSIIIGIWVYTIITGATPSVTRAAVMFSLFSLGKFINRSPNFYNILAATAFYMLIWNPNLVKDIGFQLSFSAVAGIVYFQPKVYQLLIIHNPILDYSWKLMSVSISAQLITLPLTLYYFHQFPTLFWLTGIIAVPAATIILILTIILFALNSIPIVGNLIGKTLDALIYYINLIIIEVGELPFQKVDQIWFPDWLLFPILLVLVGLVLLLETRNKIFLWGLICCLITITSWNNWGYWKASHQKKWVVYHSPENNTIDFFVGRQAFSINSQLPIKQNYHSSQFGNYRGFHRIGSTQSIALDQKHFKVQNFNFYKGVTEFQGKIIAIHSPNIDPTFLRGLPHIDFLILQDNPIIDLEGLICAFQPETIIISSSNKYFLVKKWMDICHHHNQGFHNIKDDGAFIYDE